MALRRTRLAARSRASRMLNTQRTRSHSANLCMVSRMLALMRSLRSMRACRSAWKNEDSGTELFLSNIVSSVAAAFRNFPGSSVAQDLNILRCETKARKLLELD
jgi:hypothetical protein